MDFIIVFLISNLISICELNFPSKPLLKINRNNNYTISLLNQWSFMCLYYLCNCNYHHIT